MKQLFDISFPDREIIQPVLALQLGDKLCSFAIADRSTGQLKQLTYYIADVMNEVTMENIFSSQPTLSQAFYQVRIGYQFHKAALVPAGYFHHEQQSELLNTLYGVHPAMNVIAESTLGMNLNTVYVVPGKIYQRLNAKFAGAKYWHYYSLALKSADEDAIRLDFRQDDFSAFVYREKKLLFAGSFAYSTPADVLYIVLKIAHSYQLSQRDILVQVSGLIDKDSALYQELLQYFIRVECRETSWQTGHPAHYFTSLNELSQCE